MRCGNKKCKNDNRHDTVAEVRACYGFAQTTPPTLSKLPPIHEPVHDNGQVRYRPSAHIPSIIDWSKFKQIPAGYYATPSLTVNNDLDFWKVEEGKNRWKGYIFVKRVIGGRNDADIPRDSKKKVKAEPIKQRVTQARALNAILDYGIVESNHLFGMELKYCRECGIHLTDELSRSLGIGPVCRG